MRDLIERALAEDLGAGDVTSAAVVPAGSRARGTVVAKADGVVAGVEVAAAAFEAAARRAGGGDGREAAAEGAPPRRHVAPAVEVERRAADGERVAAGDELLGLAGDARAILAGERVALNLLGRLSGVATLTARYVDAIAGTGARILDTRKTTPGMRALEKAAVVAGGGGSHRFGLYDAILVKENHVRVAGGVGEATRRALAGAADGMVVEVEVETLAELDEALAAGAGRVLLDNMGLYELRAAVQRTAGRAQLEASGGIALDTVRAVAETGVDFVSVGALTHSAAALDVSLLFEPD